MSHETVRDALRGVAVGVLTPFDEDGEIMFDALQTNAAQLSESGVGLFLANANISEFHSLTHDERFEVTRVAIEATDDSDVVFAGVGGATKMATALAQRQADAGADALMVMPPDHTYVHERGLMEYYRELGGATDLPLVPYIRGFDPSIEFLGDLTRIDDVAGVKYALEDAPKLGAAVAAGDDEVVWVNGLAEEYAPAFFAEGAEGFTAGVSNFIPALGLRLFAALERSDEATDRKSVV